MNVLEIIDEIQKLPHVEQGQIVDFIEKMPNAETLAAIEEAKHPEKLDSYSSSSEMFKSLGIKC